ncbi:hypothetical protein [Halocatena salina]|uniref:Uncharacterized protein n=1 Tax=Halocatena salina TaxID=2934340 RepID=A0A8U0A9L7_9EURY|nr:hypothetical protein [Halocatena salina]UPM45158.1 hypothetical protein MW046_17520 [Halocatena salina]
MEPNDGHVWFSLIDADRPRGSSDADEAVISDRSYRQYVRVAVCNSIYRGVQHSSDHPVTGTDSSDRTIPTIMYGGHPDRLLVSTDRHQNA